MWLDLLSVVVECFFKNLQLALAEYCGPSEGSWVVWHWFCSHTYGANGGLALCSHAPTRHTRSTIQSNEHIILGGIFFHPASDNHWLLKLRKYSIGQTPIVPSLLSHMGEQIASKFGWGRPTGLLAQSSVRAKLQLHGFRLGMGNATEDWMVSDLFTSTKRPSLYPEEQSFVQQDF